MGGGTKRKENFLVLVQHDQHFGRNKSRGPGQQDESGKLLVGLSLWVEFFIFKDEDFSDLSDFSWEEGSSEDSSSEESSSDDEGAEVEVNLQPRMRTRSLRRGRQ
jgi:hypothetical protein